ncbi:MAG: bifunctional phosphoribosylaminoimidazolecarboxamide formyltransferase/IMP cyclohydrolase [Filifactoraceae bacterium]
MKRALISVTDKSGILEFAKKLVDLDYEIISTGGTLKVLRDSNIPAISVEEITKFPEILDGRVKTLHPKIHGGLLYIRDDDCHLNTISEHDISPIDMIVVNLYDFEGLLKGGNPHDIMIENIDIGGPSMIRSAAKNYKDVLVVVDVNDYDEILRRIEEDALDVNFREWLAMKGFCATAYYDSMISRYFIKNTGLESEKLTLGFKKVETLRYGENPHQNAVLYDDGFVDSILSSYVQLNGKKLSFNNLNDLNSGIELIKEFDISKGECAAVAVKHASPCGVALGENGYEAYKKAYEADKLSIFGGIVVVNFEIDEKIAELMNEVFLEVIAAPGYTVDAIRILKGKKNLRLLVIDLEKIIVDFNIKYISGKVLVQDTDKNQKEEKFVVTKKAPSQSELRDLEFAMKVCKHVKSNGIVIAKNEATIAIGGGQTSRIWALESAINNYSDKDFFGCVMASDAFFPFGDCIELAGKKGITSVIQPGGAVRDQESISLCDEKNISMIFTGIRHFRH